MNCKDAKIQISEIYTKSGLEANPELENHLSSCEGCVRYKFELSELSGALNSRYFEVPEAELSAITFESVKNIAKSRTEQVNLWEIIKLKPLKWIWTPIAAAAVIALLMISPNYINNISDQSNDYTEIDIYSSNDLYEETVVSTPNIYTTVLTALISDDDDLISFAHEVYIDDDIDILIDNMEDSEFELLLNRLSKTSGS